MVSFSSNNIIISTENNISFPFIYCTNVQMFLYSDPDHTDRVYCAIKSGSLSYLCGSSTSECVSDKHYPQLLSHFLSRPDALILLHQRCSEGLYGSGFYFHGLRLHMKERLFTGMMNRTPLDLD